MDLDIYELARYLAIQSDPEETDEDTEEDCLERFINVNYGIDFENFKELINDLLPLCTVGKSLFTDKMYQGFGTDNFFFVKKEIE